MEADPVSVDLNVDAALVLQNMVGIDSYPLVLALMPNIYDIEDRDRVRIVVEKQLTEAGIVDDGRVHPEVVRWLHCLYRPDMELVVRIIDNGVAGHDATMLRMSLVRRGESHVLAIRCDDHVVIQPVFHQGRKLKTLAAALKSALGGYPALNFEPLTVATADLDEVPADPDAARGAWRELGAAPHTASVLTRALTETVRRTEVVMIEHHDGGAGSLDTKMCVSVLDTLSGRLVVTPSTAMDGQIWSTFRPGEDAALEAGIDALIELLPGRSWFDTSRAP
ncbi:ESX secretion-associated protein EspG [Nocardia sp. NBC_01329]|uniref:ESX secretion-associated protein EspG n=1 Tax=Nocardia sp. NBC_01329 TaxID=2903594 RepID=UPI002E153C90|nr:ESX secretion-associated protein EspG [Nocardia sp. NBC_01329]